MKLPALFRRASNAEIEVDPEQQLVGLLNSLHETTPGSDARRAIERDLLAWVDQHLRQNLRNMMLRTFGVQVTSDTSLRFNRQRVPGTESGQTVFHLGQHPIRRRPSANRLTFD